MPELRLARSWREAGWGNFGLSRRMPHMATRPQWILELHPDFPSSLLVLERRPEALVLQREDVVKGNWPDLSGPVVG